MKNPDELYVGYWEERALAFVVPGPVMNKEKRQKIFCAWIETGATQIKKVGKKEYLNMLKTLNQDGVHD